MMMQVMGSAAFSGAAAAAGWTLWASIAPQWQRILQVAAGRPDPMTSPLVQLVRAERRIAVGRITSMRPSPSWREAA